MKPKEQVKAARPQSNYGQNQLKSNLDKKEEDKKVVPKPRPVSSAYGQQPKAAPGNRFKEDASAAVNKIFDKPPEKQRVTPLPSQPSAM